MRKVSLTVIFLAFCHLLYGQARQKLKPGDKVPEVIFSILKNGTFENAKLSDFRGKLVILDYWNIWCSSCIAAFPRLASLQEKYGREIIILPVSFLHTRKALSDFIAKRKGTENEVKLPVAVFENSDNPLFQALPTTGYPYEVWIDANGKFVKASDSNEVTDLNIETFLKEGRLNFKTKNQQLSFDRKKPLLIDHNGGPDSVFTFRSIITNYIDSISKTGVNVSGIPGKTKLHLSIFNRTILDMLKYVFSNSRHDDVFSHDLYNHYIFYLGSDSLSNRMFPEIRENRLSKDWREKNSYCYDLTVPAGFNFDEAFEFMHQDIDRFFRIRSSIENQLVDCLVLIRTDNTEQIAAISRKGNIKIAGTEIEVSNRSLKYLLSRLDGYHTPILIDETGYSGNVNIKMVKQDKFDLDFINAQLKPHGLKFVMAQRLLPMLVIKQKSNGV